MASVYTLTVGDEIDVTRDGRTSRMTVWAIVPAMSAGRAISAGPSVMAHTRPGGYGVTIDDHTRGLDWVRAGLGGG